MQAIMQALSQQKINPVLKWSFVTSSIAGLMIGTGIFSIWFIIEVLAALTDMG